MIEERQPLVVQVRLCSETLDTEQLEARLAGHPAEAVRAIREAARRGSHAAQLVLGQLLLDGRLVARDPRAALGWFERAAEGGLPEAWNMVGRCHEKGWGVASDYRLAMPWFEGAIARGHVWAKVNLAQILMRLGDPADRPRAFALFGQAADAGNLKAINSLARFLEEGWVVPRDPAGAAALYRTAAERGDHWAQFNLATMLIQSDENAEARRWIERAVAGSDNGFRRRIALVLLNHGDPALRDVGLDVLERCAATGDADSMIALAAALEVGVAGRPDRRRIRALLARAAAQGHPEAVKRARRPRLLKRALAALPAARIARVRAASILQPLR